MVAQGCGACHVARPASCSLPPRCARFFFFRRFFGDMFRVARPAVHAAMRATSVRALHQLPPMPEALAEGCEPFLSKRTTHLLWTQWQAGLLQRLNEEVKGA